ncbi:hypothetical protein SDC9_197440 [bioreactor metagenome]|uniref:Uncharacterized protein n=1 Tax=bioreactor metagenome TaxID=1076179 RepID=A0A645IEU4_9ZZZZ
MCALCVAVNPPEPWEIVDMAFFACNHKARGHEALRLPGFAAGKTVGLSHTSEIQNVRQAPALGAKMEQGKAKGRNGGI